MDAIKIAAVAGGFIAVLGFAVGLLWKTNKDGKQNAKDEALAKDDLVVDINDLIKRQNERRDKGN